METWRPVVGYEGWYEVSNKGRIKRLKKICSWKPGRIKILELRKNGYLYISLYIDYKRKCFPVHRLVATAFIGHRKSNQEINHKNGIRDDNRVCNLEWVTRSENRLHANRTFGSNIGEQHGRAKLKTKEVIKIKKMIKKGDRLIDIAPLFGVTPGCLTDIKIGRNWKHIQ